MHELLCFQGERQLFLPRKMFMLVTLTQQQMLTLLFCFIRMSKPASEILQKFYLRLRDHCTSADGTPITARQLESLVRLAEARARLDLREEISEQDALVS